MRPPVRGRRRPRSFLAAPGYGQSRYPHGGRDGGRAARRHRSAGKVRTCR